MATRTSGTTLMESGHRARHGPAVGQPGHLRDNVRSGVRSAVARDPARRDAILDGVAEVLIAERRSVVEMQEVIASSGFSFADVSTEFEDTDDVLLSLVSRVTDRVCTPLRDSSNEELDVESVLLDFGTRLHHECSSVLVGLFRVFVTESARRERLASAFHAAGPGAMEAALCRFLERAVEARKLAIERPALAAEHLIGLLREPLYRELAIHVPHLPDVDDPARWIRDTIGLFLHGCSPSHGDA